jgi:hypothetical protein
MSIPANTNAHRPVRTGMANKVTGFDSVSVSVVIGGVRFEDASRDGIGEFGT